MVPRMNSIGVPAIVAALRGPAFGRWLRVVGPAWIVMLADVDAPSVITAAKGGTESGYALLLPCFAVVPVLFLVQEMTARLALATGMGHAELVLARYGRRWAAVSVIGMAVINFVAYVAEFAGIALDPAASSFFENGSYDLAKSGQVVAGGSTYQILKERLDAKPIGNVILEGKAIPVDAYEIWGIKA